MKSQIKALQSLAGGATLPLVFNVPAMQYDFQFLLGVSYAAMSGTTGVSTAVSVANDNTGTTYTSVPDAAFTLVPPAVATLAQKSGYVAMEGDPNWDLGEHPTQLKLLLTNLDATNAALVVVTFVFDIEEIG